MTNTMYQVSLAMATILDNDATFKSLCVDTIGKEFTHYVHVDMSVVEDIETPYFSFVTYTDTDRNGVDGEVLVQILVGIDRVNVEDNGSIVSENSQHLLETVAKKAIEVIVKEMTVFGLNGEKGFIKEYLNVYASPPMGEDDIQLQIDMILNTKKCL